MKSYWIKDGVTGIPVILPKKVMETRTLADDSEQEFAISTKSFTAEQWDVEGYNEAVPIEREPYTAYETTWVKGEDLIYREEIVSVVVDEEARTGAEAAAIRAERDGLLIASDWTQVADAPVDQTEWATYRQALRDVPEQGGFPGVVEWPVRPE